MCIYAWLTCLIIKIRKICTSTHIDVHLCATVHGNLRIKTGFSGIKTAIRALKARIPATKRAKNATPAKIVIAVIFRNK